MRRHRPPRQSTRTPGIGSNGHGRTHHRAVGPSQVGRLRRGAGARAVCRRFRAQDAARRAAGHLGPAGHHLHGVDGSQPRSGRGPDHLPARARAAEHAGRADRPRVLDVRHELHVCPLRRGHRHLLGADARARATGARAATAAAWRLSDARARREWGGLGLSVRAEGQHRTDGSRRTAGAAGLHRPSGASGGRRRGGSRLPRRIRAPVPDRHRSGPAGGLRADGDRHHAIGPRRQRGSGRARARTRRSRVRAARARLCQGAEGSRAERGDGRRRRHAHPARGRGECAASGRRFVAAPPTGTAPAKPWAASS